MIIHLYKLITGETIIAEFLRQEIVNETTGKTVHFVKSPWVVNDWELSMLWVTGLIDYDELPIPSDTILFVAEEHISDEEIDDENYDSAIIDKFLITSYYDRT